MNYIPRSTALTRSFLSCFLVVAVAALSCSLTDFAIAQDATKETAKRIEVDEANYLLKGFEDYVQGLSGREGTLTPDAKRALTKIAALKKDHPEDPRVIDLYERAQTAARSLRGDRIEVTEAMLAYRDMEAKKAEMLAGSNKRAWLEYQGALLSDESGVIVKPFPAESPETTSSKEMIGRRIILEGLRYPADLFLHFGRQYVAIGSAAKGYYFVDVSNRSFIGAYEAVRRYQRQVSDDIPEEWTAVGKITGTRIMVPDGGSGKSGQAYAGWLVEVDSLYVPGAVFARADDSENGGSYAGEADMAKALDSFFTVKEVPAKEGTPDELLKIFVTAIKEKNFELYKKCIHPDEQQTANQMEWIQRKWDIFQRRFSQDIVEVTVGEVEEINVVQGGANKDEEDILSEFLDEEEVKDVTDDGLKRVEHITIWLKLYDETGRIRESAKALTLRRDEGLEGFRWFVYSGFPF